VTRWEIIETTEYKGWLKQLTIKQQNDIERRVAMLRESGPSLPRPLADHVKGSTISNLKELRISSKGIIRILFVFDPQRNAVLLLGGIKSTDRQWNRWYTTAIPLAEQIYKRHLKEKEK
jgi:hypothetical protein